MEGDPAQDAGMRWFKEYTARMDDGVLLPTQEGVRYSCPCCGYPTLEERGGFEICILCNWEDDGQDDPHADEVWGGPNQDYSLAEARKYFKKYLIMYDPARPLARTNSPTIEKAKQVLIKEYEGIAAEMDPAAQAELQKRVSEAEATLRNAEGG